jgi:hypothetical protein
MIIPKIAFVLFLSEVIILLILYIIPRQKSNVVKIILTSIIVIVVVATLFIIYKIIASSMHTTHTAYTAIVPIVRRTLIPESAVISYPQVIQGIDKRKVKLFRFFLIFISSMRDIFSFDKYRQTIETYEESYVIDDDYMKKLLDSAEKIKEYYTRSDEFHDVLRMIKSLEPEPLASEAPMHKEIYALREFFNTYLILGSTKYFYEDIQKRDHNIFELNNKYIFNKLSSLIYEYSSNSTDIRSLVTSLINYFNFIDFNEYESPKRYFFSKVVYRMVNSNMKFSDLYDKEGQWYDNINLYISRIKESDSEYIIISFYPKNKVECQGKIEYFKIDGYRMIAVAAGEINKRDDDIIILSENSFFVFNFKDDNPGERYTTTDLDLSDVVRVNIKRIGNIKSIIYRRSQEVIPIVLNFQNEKVSSISGKINNFSQDYSKFLDSLSEKVEEVNGKIGKGFYEARKLFLMLTFIAKCKDTIKRYLDEESQRFSKNNAYSPLLNGLIRRLRKLELSEKEVTLLPNLENIEIYVKKSPIYIERLLRDALLFADFFVKTLNSIRENVSNNEIFDRIAGITYFTRLLRKLNNIIGEIFESLGKNDKSAGDKLLSFVKSFNRIVCIRSYFKSFSKDDKADKTLEKTRKDIIKNIIDLIHEKVDKINKLYDSLVNNIHNIRESMENIKNKENIYYRLKSLSQEKKEIIKKIVPVNNIKKYKTYSSWLNEEYINKISVIYKYSQNIEEKKVLLN